MLKALNCCTKADKPAPVPPPSRDRLSTPRAATRPDEDPHSTPVTAVTNPEGPPENDVDNEIEQDEGEVYEEPQPPLETSAEIIDDTKDPMSEIIDEFKEKIKGKSFYNNVPEKDRNYVEFEENGKQDENDHYIPMGAASNQEHCYYNNAFTKDDEDSDRIPDYVNTEEFTDGVRPRNKEDIETMNYENVEDADNGIKPPGTENAVSTVKKINESSRSVDSEDEDPSHDYVNDEKDKSWPTGIPPKILVPEHEEETPSVQQKLKKSLLRHRGSDPAKTNHMRYENTSIEQQPLQSTNTFQSERRSERKTPGVHYRPRKVPETIQETQKETKQKPATNELLSKILSLRPQVRLQSEIYEDWTKDKDGIRPEMEHSEEEREDEKPPSIAGHKIGRTQSGPSYVNAGNEGKNAEVKTDVFSCAQSNKGVQGLNLRKTSLTNKQTVRDCEGVPPPNFTCKRFSSTKESYVNVPSPAAIPPPPAFGHNSAIRGQDQTTKECYVNVPNRPTPSIFIPKNRPKPVKQSEQESSEEYESDDSGDDIYDDNLVLNEHRKTETARVSKSDEAILGTNQRDDDNHPLSRSAKQGSVITKQPLGSGGLDPVSIETLDTSEEDDDVYDDTEVVLSELQSIRSEQAEKRNHSNASTKQSTVMKSGGSINREEEEEQESFYSDKSTLDGPVLPQGERVKSSASLPSDTNTEEDPYELVEVPSADVHKKTSTTKAKTLPTDLSKCSDNDIRSASNFFEKISKFNKFASTQQQQTTPKQETTKITEPTPAVNTVERKINMQTRPPMPLPKPTCNLTISSPDLRTLTEFQKVGGGVNTTEISKVGSGINTVQRRKVQTIGTELDAKLAVLKMQKEWNQ